MMNQASPTSVRLENNVIEEIDSIARRAHRSRAWIIKEAVNFYLDERADLDIALNKLQDPSSEYIDWEVAKHDLLH